MHTVQETFTYIPHNRSDDYLSKSLFSSSFQRQDYQYIHMQAFLIIFFDKLYTVSYLGPWQYRYVLRVVLENNIAHTSPSINLLWEVGTSKCINHSSTKAVWSRLVNSKQVAGGNRWPGVGIAAEIEESVWNVNLRHVLVCVHVEYVYMCVFRVAEAFEDSMVCRGLRGMKVRW